MAILVFTAQALSNFLFHPRLSVGRKELASQAVCPWSLARKGKVSGQAAQNKATAHLLAPEGRSSCGEQSSVLFRTETCLLWHWWHIVGVVLYLPFVLVLTSCCVSALSKSKIKLNWLCYLEDVYSYIEVLDYFVDKSCGNVSLLRKVKQNHLQIMKV